MKYLVRAILYRDHLDPKFRICGTITWKIDPEPVVFEIVPTQTSSIEVVATRLSSRSLTSEILAKLGCSAPDGK